MRWELIEKFDTLKKGFYAKSQKSYSGREDFILDHSGTVPETLFIEMVAQTGGVLFGLGLDFKKELILAKVAEARFHEPVAPPCRLDIEAWIEEEREEGAWIKGKVSCQDRAVADVKLLLVSMDGLEGGKKIVFNDHFLSHYDVYAVAARSGSE